MTPITLEDIRGHAGDVIFARGERYYHDNAIFDTFRNGHTLVGKCRGSDLYPYTVQVELDEDENIQEAHCTCPYDWGGDCKHVVALLLTYYHHPEQFAEIISSSQKSDVQPPSLAERSKEQLIELIREMIRRHPDLRNLLNRPVPDPQQTGQPVDLAPIRQELRRALQTAIAEWHTHTATTVIVSVLRNARQFAQIDDWRNVCRIYRVVVEELLRDNIVRWDDEGELIEQLQEAEKRLVECLDQPQVTQDEIARREVIDCLSEVLLWEMGDGIDYAPDDETLTNIFLSHLRPNERAAFRKRVVAAQQEAAQSSHDTHQAKVYEWMLLQLDALDDGDIEVVLRRLREEGLHHLEFEKLLALERYDEAIAAAEHITEHYARLRAWSALSKAGYDEAAMQLANKAFDQTHDPQIGEWLVKRYHARGEREALFQLYRRWAEASPNASLYQSLKKAAQAVGKWEQVRPQFIRQLEQAQEFDTLAKLYLDDEEWDKAWEMVERAREVYMEWTVEALEEEVAARSRHARPRKAIPIYIARARADIDMRSREYYTEAAHYLTIVRELYKQIGEEKTWEKLIADLRKEFRRRRALQDELNKARL